ncbi:AP-4 complex subunit mu-1 [Chaetoceros tenuissimus]|uniref:AP-4 complex subunit mu-1 n=1 Tax=Chaetoceros tenuissimus TaxID=426638 RepID=A0AAD3CSK1_9STRA|nr:AP-4 complex subunit mu-1 [Chaetoceros tenuissimus]
MYRTRPEVGAHERSHTEAFFRKIKFWNEMQQSQLGGAVDGLSNNEENGKSKSEANDNSAEAGSTVSVKGKKDPPPVFVMPDGMSYLHVNRNGLIFGCSTDKNISPCTVIELLSRIAKVFKDYCGTLSEEAIRKNFILCYELLDEMIDYGYPQLTRTETLKPFVYNEPIVVQAVPNTGKMINPKTASANAVHKPVIGSVNAKGRAVNQNQKNEIFVDILERLNVIFNNNGYVVNSTIDGCIQMKSYLAGNPELRLALNEDLVIGKANAPTNSYGRVVLDDVSFHDCVNLTEFEHGRTLSFYPPDGEFVVLNYRVTGEYRTPFRIFPSVDETGPRTFEVTVMIRADMEQTHFGANVIVELPLPQCTTSATCSLMSSKNVNGPAAEYMSSEKKVLWTMKKFPGQTEQTLKVKVTLDKACTSQIRREIGPVNMNFEIPMFNVSNLNVRYLRIAENMPGYSPYRWVRYVTQSYSYVCRM